MLKENFTKRSSRGAYTTSKVAKAPAKENNWTSYHD